ncbi:hypothetical protein CK203_087512 [Vitis vinifera]|uniref:Ubiquitin-like protease family profile domain-containing protein n=1 Tax=Vitis vinifera TaxID=29760 RepID=A0A438DA74_VITVI|nr:hypothetical protein CK203_087512 [Vitis vinifera]
METKEGEKPIKRKYRGMTRKHMIIKNRSKGVKLPVKYNLDAIFIGESAVHLTRYLGMLACTMVPIRYKTWHVVPKQLKDKLWDSIENLLTVKYILPFEYQPELLKRPPIQYTFIEDEDWTIFVKDRLSDNFKHIVEESKGKKDDTFDEVAIPVIEKIDKLLKESQENGRSVSGSNDILVEALGTPEYSGRVRAKGKHYTPRQYFNSAADHVVKDFIAASKEEQRIFQAEVLAKLSQVGAVTPQSDVRKCELAIGTKENIVAGGTIILECGPNYLVVVDAPYDSSAPLPIPIPGQTTTVGAAISYQVLWPTDFVIIRTPILVTLVSKAGMGEGSKENRSRVIADRLKNTKHAEHLLIPYNPDFHWVLVALEMKKMIAYYLDPMACQPCDDLKDIVNMAMRINPPEKQKTSKREPTWVKVVCPRQPGSVECGYYVMRYMKEIITNPNQLTSKFWEKKSYSEMEINEVRSDWVMLVTQLIITHV